MIARLYGKVLEIEENNLTLDVNGVGYLIFTHKDLLQKSNIDDNLALYVQMIVKEDDISLYGFENLLTKKLFNALITVQGVGAKIALVMISNIALEELQKAIIFEDINTLKSVPGIGVKVAQRICNELKDKISNLFDMKDIVNNSSNKEIKVATQDIQEVRSALQNLGYSNNEIKNALASLDKEFLEKAKAEDIIKESLKFFVKGM